jgi:hypothetical protein
MKLPKWLCTLLFSHCKWQWYENRHNESRALGWGCYKCSRCGEQSIGAFREGFPSYNARKEVV